MASRCRSLAGGLSIEGYPGIGVTLAQYLPANTTLDPVAEGQNSTCSSWIPIPPMPVNLCRLAIHVPTSNSSEIVEEVWLPEDWSGRFLSTGNGGLGGCIQYPDLAFAASYGSASVGNNNGHNGTSGGAVFHQPEVLEDLVWRALYAGAVIEKEITRQFYGSTHQKSCYFGCSMGGRQGWNAAQFHPELFDGIMVGAPAVGVTGLFSHFARFLTSFGTDVESAEVSVEQWSAVQNETLRQCDDLDGATDGIVEDNRRCQPDLSTLLCGKYGHATSLVSTVCLSSFQLSLVESFFEPWYVDGQLIYSGLSHSGDEVFQATSLMGDNPTGWATEARRRKLESECMDAVPRHRSWPKNKTPTTSTLSRAIYRGSETAEPRSSTGTAKRMSTSTSRNRIAITSTCPRRCTLRPNN
ncbi:tannase-domain-containing protein [Pleomassaria siparia CBS 279.74]|uniref:Carboxylic ester hydrolase n=1 Tax=Pleomassaria siparia CBS 279.74 TaxID=1314801 RepID=A0A6G1K189_9PLEO|nr:tannase-domain-containing protein [Pleomassaria siparia CBS 279.74]